jgi:hypothetical protein
MKDSHAVLGVVYCIMIVVIDDRLMGGGERERDR